MPLRRYSLSGYAQEKAVMFEAREGGGLEDGEVKHYDADGMCTSGMFGSTMFSNTLALFLAVSALTKVVVYAGIETIALLSCLRCLKRSSGVSDLPHCLFQCWAYVCACFEARLRRCA